MPLLFALSASAAWDPVHAQFQRVLDAHLHGGRVDYAGLARAPAALDTYLAQLAEAPVSSLSANERKALWIDAYNACTLDVVADHWPVASIKDIPDAWTAARCKVGGETLSLDTIEHQKLRPMGDPRIHAAINCASLGCPPLAPKVYVAASLDAQLDEASRRLVATARLEGGKLLLPQILDWFGEDFVGKYGAPDLPGPAGEEEAAANFVAAYAPDLAPAIRRGGYAVAWIPYDWKVNAR